MTLERRRRIPFWPIVLAGLAVALAFLWFLFSREEPPRMTLDTPERANLPAQGAYAGTITDLAALVGPRDRAGLVGREVALEGVQVLQVLGPGAFLVGPSLSQRALVLFDPAAMNPTPKVDAGDTVALHGFLRPIPADVESLGTTGLEALAPSERADLHFHVAADTVIETVERSGTGTR
jgi:hypothetical protein